MDQERPGAAQQFERNSFAAAGAITALRWVCPSRMLKT